MPKANSFANLLLNGTFGEVGFASNASQKSRILVYTTLWAICCIIIHLLMPTSDRKSTKTMRQKGGVPPPASFSTAFLASLPFRMLWDPVHVLTTNQYVNTSSLFHCISLRLMLQKLLCKNFTSYMSKVFQENHLHQPRPKKRRVTVK
jgi:hypothetical protein